METHDSPSPPPELPLDAHKGTAGRILCLCGSAMMPGAAQLVVRAAQRAGGGLVTLAIFDHGLVPAIAPTTPEVTYLDLSRTKDLYAGRLPREIEEHPHDVRVAGPGLGRGGHTRELVRRLVSSGFSGPLVLDADALNVLSGAPEVLSEQTNPIVLTPHPGEAERMIERSVPADEDGRLACAHELATRSGAIVVLKGSGTIITDGTRTAVNTTGNPGMATGGAGDVLSGVIGAYLATSVRVGGESWGPFEAVCSAVHVHGLAGDLAARRRGVRALIASDLIEELGAAQARTPG